MNVLHAFKNTLAIAALLTLVACGGEAPPDKVVYQGTTLIVNGTRYERPAVPPSESGIVPNDIIVGFKPGQLQDGLALLNELKLPVKSTMTSLEMAVITVPTGFEGQWIAALNSFAVVRSATRNYVVVQAVS